MLVHACYAAQLRGHMLSILIYDLVSMLLHASFSNTFAPKEVNVSVLLHLIHVATQCHLLIIE
jgi:hypothetical protein